MTREELVKPKFWCDECNAARNDCYLVDEGWGHEYGYHKYLVEHCLVCTNQLEEYCYQDKKEDEYVSDSE